MALGMDVGLAQATLC